MIVPGLKNRPSTRKVEYITIHETGNYAPGADAQAHDRYLNSEAATKAKVSWHYSVDAQGYVQHIPDGEIAWHTGTPKGNAISIGIEICVNPDGDFEKALKNTAELVKELMEKHHLSIDKVVQHNFWNGKNCPKTIRESNRWGEFLRMIDDESRYEYKDGIHFIYIPIKNFKILQWDKPKRTTTIKNYFNLGFFGLLKSGKTIAGGNLCIDGNVIVEASTAPTWSNLYNKELTTLIVTADKADIIKTKTLSHIPGLKLAVSGIPIMIDGKDVSFKNDVITQGYTGGELYGTWHGFLSVKDGEIVYMAYKTKTKNCVATSEVYNKFKGYGFKDIIKLDGGGSFILDHEGKNIAVTSGNRRINNVATY